MEKERIEAVVLTILKEEFGYEGEELINDQTLEGDLNLDSLDRYTLGYEIERKLNFEVPEQELTWDTTIGYLVNYIYVNTKLFSSFNRL